MAETFPFQRLDVYVAARELAALVHTARIADAELRDQATRASKSVVLNLAEGLGNRAIAARLGISEHTAKFHVNAILGKLGAESRAAAIVKAARLGLVVL